MTGLFKGIVPRTLRKTLMAALSWTVYEQVLMSIMARAMTEQFFCNGDAVI